MSLPIPDDSRETALVIDHTAKVFHVSTNKRRYVSYLLKLAKTYELPLDFTPTLDNYACSLSNVPIKYLSKLSLATNCK